MRSLRMIALVGAVLGIAHAQQYPSGALGSYGQSASVSTTPRPLPPAQVHYVNIGEDLTGDYKFGYDTGKNDGGQSFREEARLPDGTVKGAYGYIDSEGKQRIVKYTAGIDGFKVESDEAAPGQGAPAQAPARSYQAPAPAPARSYQPPPPPQPAPVRSYQPAPQPQPLGGYTPVAATGRYVPQPAPVAQPSPIPVHPQPQPQHQYQPQPHQYRPAPSAAPSPLPDYNAALQAQLSALQSSNAAQSGQYRPQPQSIPSYSQTLAQRQPTLAQVQPRPSHLASIPRGGQPSLSSFGSSFNPTEQESTTWGPPVINKELLSYNIGVGRR